MLASEEGRRGNGQVRAVEALERRKLAVSELVDALGGREILEPVLAEVCEPELDELSRRGRDEHLPAVARRGDAGGAVDVAADIALVGEKRCPCVQTDPHADRSGGERLGQPARRGERARRGRKGEEERIALRVHLDAVVAAQASRIRRRCSASASA